MKNRFFTLPLLLILPGRAFSGETGTYEARLAESRESIYRTAEALGISVYEDFPVLPGRGGSDGAPPPYTALPERRPAINVPMLPEPEAVPVKDNSMPMGDRLGYLTIAYHAVSAQIADSGLLPWGRPAPSFDSISRRALEAVGDTRYPARRAGAESLLREPGFISELERITGTRFLPGSEVSHLIDGPASFAVKDRLIREAKKTIYIATYAIYDDVTGNETVDMLLERKKAGVDIRVMVDDKMAHVFGGRLLKKMQAAGIEILRYTDKDRSHDYLHVKLIVVDGERAVAGGMNYGDPYSHKGGGLKWRDTDTFYTGPAAAESERIFAEMWNARAGKTETRISPAAARAAGSGSARVAVVLQNPPSLTPPVLTGILKAMAGATRRINIENAYLIAIPAVNSAVIEARARGVEVNILTNSKESIDSDGKAMADTIVAGTRVFAAAGANVYLKRGETLHSKFMTVDGVFASVGSYNLHPRSERYDTELNVNILDEASTAQLDAAFEKDIAEAQRMTLAELEAKKPGLMARILSSVGFAQLSPKR